MSDPAHPEHSGERPKARFLRSWKLYLVLAAVAAGLGGLVAEVIVTRPIRDALNVYMSLVTVANRPDYTEDQRLSAARELCSAAYLESHVLKPAPEGGLVGIPRNVNKNFKAWREGPNIWICPTNRVGPIYQFVPEQGRWKFDGPVGLLRSWGEVIRMNDLPEPEGN
jgi:hypothetical protein